MKLYFDCDNRGDGLAKQALWKLNCEQLDVQLLWSSVMEGGAFAGQKPKLRSPEQWQAMTTGMRMYAMDSGEPQQPQQSQLESDLLDWRRGVLRKFWEKEN